jgi:hypothetical protein
MEISRLYLQLAEYNLTKHHGGLASIFQACKMQLAQTSQDPRCGKVYY